MIKKCPGCGAVLQSEQPQEPGYVEPEKKEEASVCRRCFRIKNYGDYTFFNKNNTDYYTMLKEINKSNDLVLYLVDIFNFERDIEDIFKYLMNPVILVLTKRDIIPKLVNDQKIIKALKQFNYNFVETVIISSKSNYQMDKLYHLIKKYQTSKHVYVVGATNAGKSTFINQMIKNHSFNRCDITTSNLPATTLAQMEIKLDNNLTLIDTPGLIDEENMINVVDSMLLKRIIPREEIKPRVFQMKPEQSLIIEDLGRIDYIKGATNSFVLYIANDIKVEKINTITNNKNYRLKQHQFFVEAGEEVVINGLGFIKMSVPGRVTYYVREHVDVYKRIQYF